MSKIIIEFSMPEEREDLQDALEGSKLRSVLQDIDNYLRNKLKYDENLDDNIEKIYQELRDLMYKECEEKGVLIWS